MSHSSDWKTAFFYPDERPTISSGFRSATTACSQVWLSLPIGRFQSEQDFWLPLWLNNVGDNFDLVIYRQCGKTEAIFCQLWRNRGLATRNMSDFSVGHMSGVWYSEIFQIAHMYGCSRFWLWLRQNWHPAIFCKYGQIQLQPKFQPDLLNLLDLIFSITLCLKNYILFIFAITFLFMNQTS